MWKAVLTDAQFWIPFAALLLGLALLLVLGNGA
jgi:hypothetical protein